MRKGSLWLESNENLAGDCHRLSHNPKTSWWGLESTGFLTPAPKGSESSQPPRHDAGVQEKDRQAHFSGLQEEETDDGTLHLQNERVPQACEETTMPWTKSAAPLSPSSTKQAKRHCACLQRKSERGCSSCRAHNPRKEFLWQGLPASRRAEAQSTPARCLGVAILLVQVTNSLTRRQSFLACASLWHTSAFSTCR